MNNIDKYAQLEARMLNYEDYENVPVVPANEPLVPILGSVALVACATREDAIQTTGKQTFVREGVLERLEVAADILSRKRPGLQLDVRYGYRALSVQTRNYERVLDSLKAQYAGKALIAAAHRQVAAPWVAGHPAGAAVDLCISKNGQPVNFGTDMWDFSKRSYTYTYDVEREARVNRWLLLDTMMAAGFAPFEGEWWHFSYGDKEWAKYYDKPAALYEQVEFSISDRADV